MSWQQALHRHTSNDRATHNRPQRDGTAHAHHHLVHHNHRSIRHRLSMLQTAGSPNTENNTQDLAQLGRPPHR